MKSRSVVLILFVVIMVFLVGCQGNPGNAKQETSRNKIVVGIMKPDVRNIEEYVTFSGRLEGIRDVMIFPQIPGTIDKIYVRVGDKVSSSQLLVKMDEENLNQVRAQYEAAKQTFERMRSLYQDSLISPQSFDQARAGFEAAEAGFRQVRNSTELRAPFAGTIVGKYFNELDVYAPGLRGILRLAVIEELKLPVSISSIDFAKVSENMTVRILADVAPDKEFIGRLRNISPGADPITGLFKAEIVIDNKEKLLPVGVFVEARVVAESRENAIIVPRSSIVMDSIAFVYNGGNVSRRVVQTGIVRSDSVEIISGIEPEEEVVYRGALGLRDGAKVERMEEVNR
jgi:RND family efflux transporter MFP subunit